MKFFNNRGNLNSAPKAGAAGDLSNFVPGGPNVGTIHQVYPSNATPRPNNLNNTDLNNSLGSFPKDLNKGLQQQMENIRLMSDMFEPHIASRGFENYRQVFSKETIPLHANTLSKVFRKSSGMDEDPVTAAITGFTGWDVSWNEVAISASSIEITTAAYGRYYKKNRLMDDIDSLGWYEETARYFAENATRTLDNLAGIRLFEGANKIFVESVADYDDGAPYAPRLTLGATAETVKANLSWESLKEAKFLMENFEEEYNIVKPDGSIEPAKRKAVIPGYSGSDYLVLVGNNGYNQLLSDPEFRKTFVVSGGYYAQQVVEQTLGLTTPVFNFKLQKVQNPLTISAQATPKVSTNGDQDLECAFVIGGNNGARVAVELSLEGWTKMINIGYDEDPKVDVFSLLAIVGWMTVTDFSVIRNEAIYCIPYVKQTLVIGGGKPSAPAFPVWKP